ncbi:MAG: FMN-binding protein [Thiohalomonadaceae bacterium]
MNEQPMVFAEPKAPSSFLLVRVLGLVALISGLLIVLIYQWTLPSITEQRRLALEKAVFQVIPGASQLTSYVVNAEGVHAKDSGTSGRALYAGYDAEGKLIGIAAEAAAQGYADAIRLLYGYSPECQCITGFSVVYSRETPGFGDKLVSDPAFLANFDALDASLNADGSALANAIVTVKHGTKTKPWQIDAISGATVSSKAVGKAINESAQVVVPAVRRHLNTEGRL